MKKLKQIGIIMLILLISELLEKFFKIPIPSAIIGMILLTVLLILKVIKLEWIEEGGNTLIALLGFLFIPTVVNAKNSIYLLKNDLIAIGIIIIVATIVVMTVTSLTVQYLNRYLDKRERDNGNK